MKKMLFVTKLIIDATKEEIYIYISLEDFKKYAFTKSDNLFIPYEDKRLLDDLNNKEKVVYYQETEEEIDEKKSEHIKRPKKKRTAKERVQKTLAGIGIAVTIFAAEPVIADGLSYSLKRINSFSHCTMIDEKTSNAEFMRQFAIAINKNQDYKEEERQVIIEGYKGYIDDWGYLLDEMDKEYLLYIAETINIKRWAWQPSWSGGYTHGKSIYLKDEGDLGLIAHESAHMFSDRGLLSGSMNGYFLGFALNEGINTSVNYTYITCDLAYPEQRKDTFKLSLLAEDEDLIMAYQKKGPEYFCRKVAERNPNINYVDVLRYLSMMDIELFLDEYKMIKGYTLPDTFFEEKEELYNKMFKAKYGYDYSESVMAEIELEYYNFLDTEFRYSKSDGFVVTEYEIPKELLASKSFEFDYPQYVIRKSEAFDYPLYLNFLSTEKEIVQYNSWDEFCRAFASQYSQTEADFNKVKSVFTQELSSQNFDYYMEYALDKVFEMNQSPEYTACYLREIYLTLKNEVYNSEKDTYTVDNFEERFNATITEFLKENNMGETLNLYINSDISFKEFKLSELDGGVLPSEYHLISQTDNYVLSENGILVVKVSEDEYIYDVRYESDCKIAESSIGSLSGESDYVRFYEMSDLVSQRFDESFDNLAGQYYYADLRTYLSLEQIATLDKDKITIYVATIVKTEDFEKHR